MELNAKYTENPYLFIESNLTLYGHVCEFLNEVGLSFIESEEYGS